MAQTPEAEVVYSLKRHLMTHGLGGGAISELIVDADHSNRSSPYAQALEPMASIRINGSRPDLVCSVLTKSRRLVYAFEVKAYSADWSQGLAQAWNYRHGVHYTYLALPWRNAGVQGETVRLAQALGVGVFGCETGGAWHEVVAPHPPLPLPWCFDDVVTAIHGVDVTRRLALNHPLNYLVVPHLRVMDPISPLQTLLAEGWRLNTAGSRQHAIRGACALGLIDRQERLTAEGHAVGQLMGVLGLNRASAPPARERLVDAAPAFAAVARMVILRQPAAALIQRTLQRMPGRSGSLLALILAARVEDPVLTDALFVRGDATDPLLGRNVVPTTVFQFKQILWHSGILSTKASEGAGQRLDNFNVDMDRWALDNQFVSPSGPLS